MICPRCETPSLVAHQRGGMEVDVCRTCGGVWLDRGELERLALTPPAPATEVFDHGSEPEAVVDDKEPRHRRDREKAKDRDRDREKKRKKPKSLGARVVDVLDEVFDEIFD